MILTAVVLMWISSETKQRSILCKIRLSAHNLAIERARHLGLHTSDRICTICKTGDVENECHFLFECEKYSNNRRSFQCNILSILQKRSFYLRIKYSNSV